jgi:type II secretory pathway pseudopilin PulG
MKVPGGQGARVPGCRGAGVPGCRGARVPGCQGASSEAGFSLIELLVSAAIMLTVTGAIFGLMNPAHGSQQAQTEVADVQQRMRVASDVLFKELVMTGAGIYQGPTTGSLIKFFAPILPRRTGYLNPDPRDKFRPDALTLMYVPNEYTQTTIRQQMPINSPEMKVMDQANCPKHDGLCGFDTGMVVLIFDSTGHFDTFEITNLQSDAAHLQHRGQGLDYSYGTDAQVTQIVSNTYYRDATTNQLMRYNGGLTVTPLVDNLVDMQVSYFGDPNPPKPPLGQANCLYDAAGLPTVPELPVLPLTDGSLAALAPAILIDGPFCGGDSNQYDADLLRVRKVRVMLRMQVASAALRGLDQTLWRNPGQSQGGARTVPDYTVTFDVAPRNLNLAR